MPDALQGHCPAAGAASRDAITLAHGEGGRLMRRLIADCILPELDNPLLRPLADAARLPMPAATLAVTTDSYVVAPLAFPGGDIGTLAVYGTVNDLAVAGARPLWITLAMILEEGLPIATLRWVLASVARAAKNAGTPVVAGDTKVVPRGAADGLFLCASGIGELVPPVPPGPSELREGDEILASGPLGCHGVAVIAARERLGFDPPPASDCAPLLEAVEALRRAKIPIRAMRDATRGGAAAVLHEWAQASGRTMVIDQQRLPVTDEVRGVCELLGLDPIHVACEGAMLVAVPPGEADAALAALRGAAVSARARRIGVVAPRRLAAVVVRRLGQELPLDEPLGAPLPRIC